MKSNYRKIGEIIKPCNERNNSNGLTKLFGINIDKYFMPSVANIVGTDLSTYKIVKTNQFACNRMHVGRDKRLPVALSNFNEDFLVSPAYDVFEVRNKNEVLPEYLMMWFSRKEFDRNSWFYTDSDVRGGLSWEDFCDMKLPVPSIEKQKEIIKEYHAVLNRIELNNQIITKLEETAQALYKSWFVDFEFPDENGKPYKSNGGKMIESELGEIPKGWYQGYLSEIAFISTKKIFIDNVNENNYISTENMLKNKEGIIKANSLPETNSITRFSKNDILISNIRPYFKKIWLASFDGGCSNDVLCLKPKSSFSSEYVYYSIERDSFFDYVMAGSNGVKMPRGDKEWIMKFPILKPDKKILEKFKLFQENVSLNKKLLRAENQYSIELTRHLLTKLTAIEV